jgi:hypothetical protein
LLDLDQLLSQFLIERHDAPALAFACFVGEIASICLQQVTERSFGIKPKRLAADTAYGSGANLNWLVTEKQIAPRIPVIDKSARCITPSE